MQAKKHFNCAAAGLQTPKVLGTGQSSPRKHALSLGGDGSLDGGAFQSLQGGIRRTKRYGYLFGCKTGMCTTCSPGVALSKLPCASVGLQDNTKLASFT